MFGIAYREMMGRRSHLGLCAAMAAAILAPPLAAQPSGAPAPAATASTWPALTDVAVAGPRRFEKDHVGTFNGQKIAYRSVVAETILKDADGHPASSVFNTSFIARGRGASASRPVLFVYNGGPGGASNALMLGAFGPKRMASFTPADLANPATPLIANRYSILDVTDLVFIDPPETGYGRPLAGTDPKIFRSIDGDSFAVGQVILQWLRENGRTASPIYLAGESYGTLRSVVLARDLARATPRIELSGIVLISQAITYNGASGAGVIQRPPDPLRPITRLPDAAAMAWYHGKIDNKRQTLPEAVEKLRKFARTDYAEAILLGNRLDEAGRRRTAARLAELTGIPADYYLANNLRLADLRGELLRDRGLVLDQFDGRETEPAGTQIPDRDRDWDAVVLGLTENFMAYAAADLGVKGLERYRSIVPDPYGFEDSWQYLKPPAASLDLVLAEQLRTQKKLRVFVPMGIFDTTSSASNTEAMLSQLDIPTDRVALRYYPGGHMLYSDEAGLAAFNEDMRHFLRGEPLASGAIPEVRAP